MKKNYMDNKLFNQIVNYLMKTHDIDVEKDGSSTSAANNEIIKKAVSEFKNFNSQYCFYDCTIAHIAAMIDDDALIELISRKAPEIFKIKDNFGKTPADYAVENLCAQDEFLDTVSLYTILNVAPETFPLELCKVSEKTNKILESLFDDFNMVMKEKNDGAPEYIKNCADKIAELNKIIKQKTEKYKAIEESNKMINKVVPQKKEKTKNTLQKN